jgi:hypothetical protein
MKLMGCHGVEVKLSDTEESNRIKSMTSGANALWDMMFRQACADCKTEQRIYARSYCRECEKNHKGNRRKR